MAMAAAKYGCSECLCIAIESHRSALVSDLLNRKNVVYRDMYWSTRPRALQRMENSECLDEYYPLLHLIRPDGDLSRVGIADCRHVPFDEELREPLCWTRKDRSLVLRDYRTLVSLPMLARWHSRDGFDAEQMLRNSLKFDRSKPRRKFDYSEPQFFHTFIKPRSNDEDDLMFNYYYEDYIELQDEDELGAHFDQLLCVAFETLQPKKRVLDIVLDSLHVYELTSRPVDLLTVEGHISDGHIGRFCRQYGTLATLFNSSATPDVWDEEPHFLRDVQTQLERGADLNLMLLQMGAVFLPPVVLNSRLPSRFVSAQSVLSCVWSCTISSAAINSGDPRVALLFNVWFQFLLLHGFSVFIADELEEVPYPDANPNLFYLEPLFERSRSAFLPFVRGVAAQLLSLGYGRRELRYANFPIPDANLCDTRQAIEKHQTTGKELVARELQSLVTRFDAGPLTLRELSRIAIRRAVGGVDFDRRVRQLGPPILPRAMFDYVSEPTELMLSDADLNELIGQWPNPCIIQ